MKDRQMDRDWNLPVRYPDPAIEILDSRFSGSWSGVVRWKDCGLVAGGMKGRFGLVIADV